MLLVHLRRGADRLLRRLYLLGSVERSLLRGKTFGQLGAAFGSEESRRLLYRFLDATTERAGNRRRYVEPLTGRLSALLRLVARPPDSLPDPLGKLVQRVPLGLAARGLRLVGERAL